MPQNKSWDEKVLEKYKTPQTSSPTTSTSKPSEPSTPSRFQDTIKKFRKAANTPLYDYLSEGAKKVMDHPLSDAPFWPLMPPVPENGADGKLKLGQNPITKWAKRGMTPSHAAQIASLPAGIVGSAANAGLGVLGVADMADKDSSTLEKVTGGISAAFGAKGAGDIIRKGVDTGKKALSGWRASRAAGEEAAAGAVKPVVSIPAIERKMLYDEILTADENTALVEELTRRPTGDPIHGTVKKYKDRIEKGEVKRGALTNIEKEEHARLKDEGMFQLVDDLRNGKVAPGQEAGFQARVDAELARYPKGVLAQYIGVHTPAMRTGQVLKQEAAQGIANRGVAKEASDDLSVNMGQADDDAKAAQALLREKSKGQKWANDQAADDIDIMIREGDEVAKAQRATNKSASDDLAIQMEREAAEAAERAAFKQGGEDLAAKGSQNFEAAARARKLEAMKQGKTPTTVVTESLDKDKGRRTFGTTRYAAGKVKKGETPAPSNPPMTKAQAKAATKAKRSANAKALMEADMKSAAQAELAEPIKDTTLTRGDILKNVANSVRGFVKRTEGSVSPQAAVRLGSAAAGGAVGAATDPYDNPILSTAAGVGLGAIAPNLVTKAGRQQLKDLAPDYYRANLLMNARNFSLPLNVSASYPSMGVAGVERALSGKGSDLLKQVVSSPDKWLRDYWSASKPGREAEQLLRNAGEFERGEQMSPALAALPKWAQNRLSATGRHLAAGDIAGRNIGKRAGLSDQTSREITSTSEPYMKWSKKVMGLKRGKPEDASPAMEIALPFVRTNINQLEQSLERLPLWGLKQEAIKSAQTGLPQPSRREKVVKQGMGGGAMVTGYTLGTTTPKEYAPFVYKILTNYGGQYGMLAGTSFLAGQAAQLKGSSVGESIKSAGKQQLQDAPLPTSQGWLQIWNAITKGQVPKAWVPFQGLIPNKE
jgi:hypothetical protein